MRDSIGSVDLQKKLKTNFNLIIEQELNNARKVISDMINNGEVPTHVVWVEGLRNGLLSEIEKYLDYELDVDRINFGDTE